MKVHYVFLLLTFCVVSTVSSQNEHEHWECNLQNQVSVSAAALCPDTTGSTLAENGRALTPKGDLRILIIYAGFVGQASSGGSDNRPLDGWQDVLGNGQYDLPSYLTFNSGEISTAPVIFNKPEDFAAGGPIDNVDNRSSSKIFNIMSHPNEDFRMMGEVFSDSVGTPAMVVIDPFIDPFTGQQWTDPCDHPRTWSTINRMVIQNASLINPNFDWERFDERTGVPNYECDNSQSGSDGKLDYVVIIYKYTNNSFWDAANSILSLDYGAPCGSIDTINEQRRWFGSGGGYAGLSLSSGVGLPGGDSLEFNAGFTYVRGIGDHNNVFVHEFSHTVYSCPHFFSGNNVAGNYYYKYSSGWGATAQRPVFSSLTAFERWYLGYIDPVEPTQDTTFTLQDFVSTGDAIRIEVPNSGGQHLWIENHTGNHELDTHPKSGTSIGPNGETLTNSPEGIYMYVENMASTRSTVNIAVSGANGLKFINASGNYDFDMDTTLANTYVDANNAIMYRTERKLENSIGGINPMLLHRSDYNGNSQIQVDTNFNGGGNQEHRIINREYVQSEDKNLYRNTMADTEMITGYNRSPAFQEGDVIGIGSNPNLFNYAKFSFPLDDFEPTYLNGLRVEVISIDGNGNAILDIKFEETEVKENIRWTGNIVLPEITDGDADLILAENKQITLDLTGTANKRHIDSTYQDFFNSTRLTISSGTKLHMKYNSRILVNDRSTLVIEDGAEVLLEDKACIVVEPGGTLHYQGEDIILNGSDAVIILKGTLKTDDDVDFTFKGTGYADIHSTHTLDMGVGSNFNLNRLNLPGQGTRFLRIRENTNLNIQDRFLDLKGGKVLYDINSKISATNADVRFTASKFEPSGSLTGTDLPVALEATDLLSLDIRKSTFEDLGTGIKVTGVATNPIMLTNNFTHCEKGLELSEIDEVTISQHTFTEQSDFSVKLFSVDEVSFVQTDILHSQKTGIGLDLQAVNFAYITLDSHIDDCDIGIKSETSNVFLNNGTTISNNNEGVKFVNNPTAEYLLSVGRCRCANVIDNNIGVVGDNIVLDIDAPTHFWDCNTLEEHGNKFDGNITIFDICYTDPAFNTFNSILARGNFWGGQSVNNYPYTIHDCVADITISIDDSDFVANVNDLPSCFSSDPSPPTDPQYPSHQLAKIGCKKVLGGVQVEVHTQAKSAHKDLYEKEYPIAETKFQPVSNIDITNDNNDKCVNIVNISRCITRALENDRYAALNSYWLDEATRSLPKYQDQITVFPNPTSGAFTIDSKNEEEYFVKIISATGNTVYSSKFINMLIVDKKDFKKGIYFLEFQQNETGNISVQKLLIQ